MEFKGFPRPVKSHERLGINRNIMEFKECNSDAAGSCRCRINRNIMEFKVKIDWW